MTEPSSSEFSAWSAHWLRLAAYSGRKVPDLTQRIDELLKLWEQPIPGSWQRSEDPQLVDPAVRYRRGDLRTAKDGTEHALERDVLCPDPATEPTVCLGLRLIDGVNAVPLVRDAMGGRAGDVEADMLLLTGDATRRRLLLVEVKTISNTAWYAAVESLRQLRLFSESPAAQHIMRRRQAEVAVGELGVTAVVLAPAAYYETPGKVNTSINPAQALCRAFATHPGISLRLAVWDPAKRVAADLSADFNG